MFLGGQQDKKKKMNTNFKIVELITNRATLIDSIHCNPHCTLTTTIYVSFVSFLDTGIYSTAEAIIINGMHFIDRCEDVRRIIGRQRTLGLT